MKHIVHPDVQISHSELRIATARLDLVPASPQTLQAELALDRKGLGQLLAAAIPGDWPPPLYDDDWRKRVLRRLREDPAEALWWVWYFLLRGEPRTLIGAGGFKGPPSNGQVEIGYSVLPSFQRSGFATEAAGGLVKLAFHQAEIARVIAHTLPDLHGSIRVLENNGFQQRGEPEEPDAIRFELGRNSICKSTR